MAKWPFKEPWIHSSQTRYMCSFLLFFCWKRKLKTTKNNLNCMLLFYLQIFIWLWIRCTKTVPYMFISCLCIATLLGTKKSRCIWSFSCVICLPEIYLFFETLLWYFYIQTAVQIFPSVELNVPYIFISDVILWALPGSKYILLLLKNICNYCDKVIYIQNRYGKIRLKWT